MTIALQVMMVLGAVVLGWFAGMFTFKRSLRWCPHCGRVLRCPDCVWPVVRS